MSGSDLKWRGWEKNACVMYFCKMSEVLTLDLPEQGRDDGRIRSKGEGELKEFENIYLGAGILIPHPWVND